MTFPTWLPNGLYCNGATANGFVVFPFDMFANGIWDGVGKTLAEVNKLFGLIVNKAVPSDIDTIGTYILVVIWYI